MRSLAWTVLALLGCSTTHSLAPRAPSPGGPKGSCAIGVAALRDSDGVDHALDLRDRLRTRGPCRTVVAVATPDAEGVDVVVGGKVDARLEAELARPATMAIGVGLGMGLAATVAGGVLLVTASEPERGSDGFVRPDDRGSYEFVTDVGTALLVGGVAVSALSVGGLVIDAAVVREIVLQARIDAEVTVWRAGSQVDTLSLHDNVVVRTRHPHGRPEGRDTPTAYGPLYREAMEHVLDHIASRVGDIVEKSPSAARGEASDEGDTHATSH